MTNKRDQEDQMVERIAEYDGMGYMARTVPDLMLRSTKFQPDKPIRENYDFPGACQTSCRYLGLVIV